MPSPIASRAVDTHAHVFSATAPAIAGARYRPGYAATLEAWQAHWPRNGITGGVVVQVSFFGTDNGEVLAAIARDPERLRGVAIVAPEADAAALRALDDAGIRALRLNLTGVGDFAPFSTAAWRALFDRAAALGWHVEVLVDAGRVPAIAEAMAAHALPVVFDHFGNPGATDDDVARSFEAIARLAVRKPVWCKLSAPYRLGGAEPRRLAERWLEIVGPARLVWGSDWPWTGHEAARDYDDLRANVERWVGVERAPAVLWDNAARLYRFS